jgi:hypothetical protein
VGISLWHKDVIMYPERSFISGRALMYVDLVEAPED